MMAWRPFACSSSWLAESLPCDLVYLDGGIGISSFVIVDDTSDVELLVRPPLICLDISELASRLLGLLEEYIHL